MAARKGRAGSRRATGGDRRGPTEWVGGRFVAPVVVAEGEPYRPELIIWLEMPSGEVVGHHLQDPKAPMEFGAMLTEVMKRPLQGPPRRPAAIRVATLELADSARRALGPGDIDIVIGPTPELDALSDALTKDFGAVGDFEPSYFEQDRVSTAVVSDLFIWARVLYRMAPWKVMDDEQLIRVDVPEAGVHGACLSVIGRDGGPCGLVLFPSLAGFEAFVSTERPRGDGPVDFGTTLLSLDFDRRADLPESMLREIADHGWPVAGPRAYPVVVHRDRDGVPLALTESDVRVMATCAGAFGSFFRKNKAALRSDDEERISESHGGDGVLTVHFTYPYESDDFIEAVDETAPPDPIRAEPQVARNAPCPCGSGLKYKRCHLASDEAKARESGDPRPPVHAMDKRLVDELERFAMRRFGDVWLVGTLTVFHDVDHAIQLASPWSVYSASVDGRTVVDAYLAERGQYLSADERSWLEAQQRSWLTIWEVTEVEPGRGLRVRDLLTGEERQVREILGSRSMVKRDTVLGRIVDHDGISVFCGMHPNGLPPLDAAEVVRDVRARLRRKTAPSPEHLRKDDIGLFMIRRWEEAVELMTLRAHTPPQVTNTDGEKMVLTTDVFLFKAERRVEIERLLRTIEDVEPPEGDDDRYVFFRDQNRDGATVMGNAAFQNVELVVETNSVERADALRVRIEKACGDLLSHVRREQANPFGPRLVQPAETSSRSDESPETVELVRTLKQRHYREWADQPVPALQGKTPREAIQTSEGRTAVDVLLKDFENREQRSRPEARVDFAEVRKDLGLPA